MSEKDIWKEKLEGLGDRTSQSTHEGSKGEEGLKTFAENLSLGFILGKLMKNEAMGKACRSRELLSLTRALLFPWRDA